VKHLMVDIETLGGLPNGFVAQIAAVWFDPDRIELGPEFNVHIVPENPGQGTDFVAGSMDYDTVRWWLRQSKEAQEAVFNPPPDRIHTAVEAITQFVDWFRQHEAASSGEGACSVWAAGNYDLPLLEGLAERAGVEWPIKYGQQRDFRTLRKEVGERLWVPPPDRSPGRIHEALSDAVWQARYCCQILRAAHGAPYERAHSDRVRAVVVQALASKARQGDEAWAQGLLKAMDEAATGEIRPEDLVRVKPA
jgi:hypothetical protein